MRMRTTAATLAILMTTTLLAGCMGGSKPASTDDPEHSHSPSPSSSGPPVTTPPPTSGAPGNLAPIVQLALWSGGRSVTPTEDGLAIFTREPFIVNVSQSLDPDGDDLSFEIRFDEGAKEETANATHTYLLPGIYELSVNVSDGQATSHVGIEVNVTMPAPVFFDGAEGAVWTHHQYVQILVLPPEETEGTVPDPADDGVNQTVEGNGGVDTPTASVGWHTTTAQQFNGSKSFTFQDEDAGGYHDREASLMVSPSIDLDGLPRAFLHFAILGAVEEDGDDRLYWRVSSDNGATWSILGSTAASYAAWTNITVDLSSKVGSTVQLQFDFMSGPACSIDTPEDVREDACGQIDFPGYFIDAIYVSAG